MLDVGTASGEFLTVLRNHNMVAVGIEPDAERVATARRAGEDARLGRFTAETAAQFTEQFDLIAFRECFYYIDDHRAALDAVKKLLAPGGCVYFKSHVPTSPYYWRGIPKSARIGPACTRFMNKRELVALLDAEGFEVIATRRIMLAAAAAIQAWNLPTAFAAVARPFLERGMRFLPPDRVMIVARRRASR